jgi:hypothetical protein
MEWTSELEQQIQYIGNCARGYIWMLTRDVQTSEKEFQRIKYVSISLGVLSGSLATLSLAIGVDNTQFMILLSAILSFCTSMCQGYLNNIGYESDIGELKRQISKYSGLLNNIKRQLGISRENRESAQDYHRWISESYAQLSEFSINEETFNAYRIESEKLNLPIPIELNKDSNITIHSPTSPSSHEESKEESKEPLDGTFSNAQMAYELSRLNQ